MASTKIKELNFNHPVKELIIAGEGAPAGRLGQRKGLTSGGGGYDEVPVGSRLHRGPSTPRGLHLDNHGDVDRDTLKLTLNGHDRFAARPLTYFTGCQVLQHHSSSVGEFGENGQVTPAGDAVAVYSFALKPEEHQPRNM